MFKSRLGVARLSADPDALARIERKLDRLLDELGITPDRLGSARDSALSAQLRQLVGQGRKIEAIKLLREHCGADLVTAKRAVDTERWDELLAGR